MRVHGIDLEAVDVRLGSPILRVLVRSILPYVPVAAVAHEEDDADHAAQHRSEGRRNADY